MTTRTRTKLAIAMRQFNEGLLSFDDYYHAVCAALMGE